MKIGRSLRYARALYTAVVRPLRPVPLPIHLQIEPTDFCNLNCASCPRPSGPPHHLLPESFNKILHEADPLKIAFSGLGEPLTHPHLFSMIRSAKEQGRHVNITSNMTMAEHRLESMVESGLDLLKISIDSATRETYQRVRGCDAFEPLIQNLKALQELKQKKDSLRPHVRFQFVLQGKNLHEIEAVIHLAEELGVEAVYFQPLELDYVKDHAEELIQGLEKKDLLQRLKTAEQSARKAEVATNLSGLLDRFETYWKKYEYPPRVNVTNHPCFRPWITAYVTATGEMWPCCQFGGLNFSVGNVLDEPFDAVWNGERMIKFRARLKKEVRPFSICKNCVPERLSDVIVLPRIWPGLF